MQLVVAKQIHAHVKGRSMYQVGTPAGVETLAHLQLWMEFYLHVTSMRTLGCFPGEIYFFFLSKNPLG